MSATGRGPRLGGPEDYYATPSWAVDRLLEAWHPPGGLWVEPSAGDGAIIRAVNARRSDVEWAALEIREECFDVLSGLTNRGVAICDFLYDQPTGNLWKASVVIGNPPYSLAFEFIKEAQARCPDAVVCFLLRLNFAASGERADFMRRQKPSVYVLPNRPVFAKNKDGKWSGDSCEYAWFVFDGKGTFRVLGTTPKAERCGGR